MAAIRRDIEVRLIWDAASSTYSVLIKSQIEHIDPDTNQDFTKEEKVVLAYDELPAQTQSDGITFVQALRTVRNSLYPLIRP